MLAQAHQAFVEADLAYRREHLAAFRVRSRGSRAGWARRLRESLRKKTDLRGGRPLPGSERSFVQPNGWNPTAYIRPASTPYHSAR
jgi:hypothetical protein